MRLIDIEAPCKIEIELDGEKCHTTVTAPTIDAVPVVRCKDCKHLFTDFVMDGKEYKRCEMQMAGFHDDWFCADGERKDNEQR